MMNNYSFDIFLSYAHDDDAFARKLVGWLRHCGYTVWIDDEQLVPGSRFRAGLQQGLRESRDMVAILTPAYVSRPWTQREIDLFDLDADRTERKVLAIQVGDLPAGVVDQVFLVHQRISWKRHSFDPEAFWKLGCGLSRERPGPQEEWKDKGNELLKRPPRRLLIRFDGIIGAELIPSLDTIDSPLSWLAPLAERALSADTADWRKPFSELREGIRDAGPDRALRYLIELPWAGGHAELAAVCSLAMISDAPGRWVPYQAWPFVDLSCSAIAGWFLAQCSLADSGPSEIWFSWTASQRRWELLLSAAARAPSGLAGHFQYLSTAAAFMNQPFEKVEAEYNYGVMITPWNHFHLCWIANRLGDTAASASHARKLCAIGLQGDVRAGRFVNRLSTWPGFFGVREKEKLDRQLATSREHLGLVPLASIPLVQDRLFEIWNRVIH